MVVLVVVGERFLQTSKGPCLFFLEDGSLLVYFEVLGAQLLSRAHWVTEVVDINECIFWLVDHYLNI